MRAYVGIRNTVIFWGAERESEESGETGVVKWCGRSREGAAPGRGSSASDAHVRSTHCTGRTLYSCKLPVRSGFVRGAGTSSCRGRPPRSPAARSCWPRCHSRRVARRKAVPLAARPQKKHQESASEPPGAPRWPLLRARRPHLLLRMACAPAPPLNSAAIPPAATWRGSHRRSASAAGGGEVCACRASRRA